MILEITHDYIDYEFDVDELSENYIDGTFRIRTGLKILDTIGINPIKNSQMVTKLQDKLYQMALVEIASEKADRDLDNRLDNIEYERNLEC